MVKEPKVMKLSLMMPIALEDRLKREHGFTVFYNASERCLIATRYPGGKEPVIAIPVKKPTVRYTADGTIVFPEKLSQFEKEALETRCDRIVDYFPDPYSSVMAVRQRLHNVAQGMTPVRCQFVMDWMEENFPESLAREPVNNRKRSAL